MTLWKSAQQANVGWGCSPTDGQRLIGISAPSWNQLTNEVEVVAKGGKLGRNKEMKEEEQASLGRETKVTLSSSVSNLSQPPPIFCYNFKRKKQII